MKTTDLLYQNQKVLNALQEMLLTSKKHVEFLAANAPEIRTSLESIAESLQTGCDILENQIVFNRDTRNKFAKVGRAVQNLLRMLPHKLVHRFNGR